MCLGWKFRGNSLQFCSGDISKFEIHTFLSKCTVFYRNTHFSVEIHICWLKYTSLAMHTNHIPLLCSIPAWVGKFGEIVVNFVQATFLSLKYTLFYRNAQFSIGIHNFQLKYTPVSRNTHFLHCTLFIYLFMHNMCVGWKFRGNGLLFCSGDISEFEIHTLASSLDLCLGWKIRGNSL